jgi:hypothetical protein
MHWTGWVAFALALQGAGWRCFDGLRALTVGDYVTASAGPRAGQLGPWSKVVAAVGLDPRGAVMKWTFVASGLAGLVAAVAFALGASWGWAAMVAMAVATLWYAPLGTVTSAIQLVLLLLPPLRR